MIEITKKAREYIDSKNKKDITIQCPEHRMQCCSVSAPTLEVFLKAPSKTELFKIYNQDGYRIFISKILREKEKITIDLNKVLMIKYLSVDGFDLWN